MARQVKVTTKEMEVTVHQQFKDSAYNYIIDLSFINTELNLTCIGATWTTKDTSIVDITGDAFSAPNTSALITANKVGEALIKVAVTTDSTDKPVIYLKIKVINPEKEA